MLLRSKTLLYYDHPNSNIILRSGRELLEGSVTIRAAASNQSAIRASKKTLDNSADNSMKPVPDEVPSKLVKGKVPDETAPDILRASMRVPVDATEWNQLGCEDRQRLALEGRAPIKSEGPDRMCGHSNYWEVVQGLCPPPRAFGVIAAEMRL